MAIHNDFQLFVLDDLNITSVRCCTIIPTLNAVAENWPDANFEEQQLVKKSSIALRNWTNCELLLKQTIPYFFMFKYINE
jgi:hypothetical protein